MAVAALGKGTLYKRKGYLWDRITGKIEIVLGLLDLTFDIKIHEYTDNATEKKMHIIKMRKTKFTLEIFVYVENISETKIIYFKLKKFTQCV